MDKYQFNKYTYNYNSRSDLRNNKINKNYDENTNYNNYNNIQDYSLRNEYDENNINNNNFILLNEINELKKKFSIAKEKLEIAKSQKENDDKYIKNLENQLISKQNKNENPNKNIRIPKNNNYMHKNEKNQININKENKIRNNNNLNNSKYNKNDFLNIRNTRSSFSDFSMFDNNSSFTNQNRTLKANKANKKNQIPIPKNNNRLKRNNSVIINKPYINKENNKKKKTIKNHIIHYFSSNPNNINENYLIKENKIIIKNCNCIINFNRGGKENSNYISLFQKTLSNKNDNLENKNLQKIEKSPKIEIKKTTQERYLIIDKAQKPLYIKGKQILGMKLMPLKGDNNEIIVDNDNNIFLYDLEGGLHNQADLKNIILDNGLPLLNENNMPILGINNIPIIDQFGDFLLSKEPLIDEYNNYIKGVCVEVLRDKKGMPIKIFIEKKTEIISDNYQNFKNKSINNNLNNPNSNNENKLINNPLIEIEMKPYTKIITTKDKNYYYYLKKYQRNIKSPYNEKNRFNFEKSLRNYYPHKNNNK